MQDSNLREKGDAPRIPAQKPAIAAKPKYVPPVNLKTQRAPRDDVTQNPSRKAAEQPHRQVFWWSRWGQNRNPSVVSG